MSRTKVLIADDETDILDVMARKIESQGYGVVKAKDGLEAWEAIVRESPDVIVLDLTMPKLDGFEVLKKLREDPPSAKWQPVIIVSGRSELEDMKKGFSLEADHYLTKPCKIEDVLKGIKLMLSLIPQHKPNSEIEEEGT